MNTKREAETPKTKKQESRSKPKKLGIKSRLLWRSCKIKYRAVRDRIKKLQHRFGTWIREGDSAPKAVKAEKLRCQNCGEEYSGRYCGNCGQARVKNHLSSDYSMSQLFYAFSNIDSRFWRSVWHLLLRPGYLIRDYLNGKRARYLHPFEMLFILSALYYLLTQLMGIRLESDPEKLQILGFSIEASKISPWLQAPLLFISSSWQKSLALKVIAMLPLYIISGKWAFRKKSKEEGLSWAAWIVLQSYILSAVSLISIISLAFIGSHQETNTFDAPAIWILIIQTYTYMQLFHYGFWGTMRRVLWQYLLLFFLALISLTTIILLIKGIVLLFGIEGILN